MSHLLLQGSTGKPKGVCISHFGKMPALSSKRSFLTSCLSSGASNTCKDINKRWEITDQDAVLSLASLYFDLSVYDLFGVLAHGGRLIMPDWREPKNPEHWLEMIEKHDVTIWNTAPPVMSMMLTLLQNCQEAKNRFRKLKLKLIMLSGDFIPTWVPAAHVGVT